MTTVLFVLIVASSVWVVQGLPSKPIRRSSPGAQAADAGSASSDESGATCADLECEHACSTSTGTPACTCDTGKELRSDGRTCKNVCTKNCEYDCEVVEGNERCFCPTGDILNVDQLTCSRCRFQDYACLDLVQKTHNDYVTTYNKNYSCSWTITADPGKRVLLIFKTLVLPEGVSLTVTGAQNPVQRYFGKLSGFVFVATADVLELHLYADFETYRQLYFDVFYGVHQQGISDWCTVSNDLCPAGTTCHTESCDLYYCQCPSGTIPDIVGDCQSCQFTMDANNDLQRVSYEFRGPITSTFDCSWTINAPDSQNVDLMIEDHLSDCQTTGSASLTVKGGASDQSFQCGEARRVQSENIISTGKQMTVAWEATDLKGAKILKFNFKIQGDDVDECAEDTDQCAATATCHNDPRWYTCTCPVGYEVVDYINCGDANECMNSTVCGTGESRGYCRNTIGSYECYCDSGYTFNSASLECEDINECDTPDKCGPSAAGTCSNIPGSFTCTCETGYQNDIVTKKCEDSSLCVSHVSSCDSNARCEISDGSATCVCNTGYSGDGTSCSDVDECSRDADICGIGYYKGACTNSEGTYTCTCGDGFTYDSTTKLCNDINECEETDKCGDTAAGDCENYDGSYQCDCNDDYENDIVTKKCELTSLCDSVDCTNTPNSHCAISSGTAGCACNMGYEDNGGSCQDIDECATPDKCGTSDAGSCTNSEGSFTCNCNTGYQNDALTKKCELSSICDLHDCSVKPNSHCEIRMGNAMCVCDNGYTENNQGSCEVTSS